MASKKSVRRATKTKTKASSAKPSPATASSPRGAMKSRAVSPHLLSPGTKAPDFTLRSAPDKSVTLSEFRGRPVILAFYPADWSPTCGDQLALYNEVLPEFERHNAQLIAISVDGAWCHAAYAKSRNLRFPLLSDFEPKGAVAKMYGTYMPSAGWSGRALFVLDGTGTIRWSYLSPIGVNPGADGVLTALESLDVAGRPLGAFHAPGANLAGPHAMSRLMPPPGARDHARGPADAPATLVEYGDFECPHCGTTYPVVRGLERRFGDRLRFIFRNFPLTQVHPHAEHAAEAAEAAARAGKFWEMYEAIFEHQGAITDRDLAGYAAGLGLDPSVITHALAEHTYAPRVQEDFMSGVRSGVNGTPTFFINGKKYNGDYDAGSLGEAIEEAIADATAGG